MNFNKDKTIEKKIEENTLKIKFYKKFYFVLWQICLNQFKKFNQNKNNIQLDS